MLLACQGDHMEDTEFGVEYVDNWSSSVRKRKL